jgi:hypothetical protein
LLGGAPSRARAIGSAEFGRDFDRHWFDEFCITLD